MMPRRVQTRKTRLVAAAMVAAATLLGVCWAQTIRPDDWATGARLQKRLIQPVAIYWSDNPLREALVGLSRLHRVAVLIDRRVDPGQQLQLKLDNVPLGEALQEIARSRQLGVSLLEDVAYFGPAQASSRLRTIAALRTEEIRQLPSDVQRVFLLPKPIAWDDLATPRELIARLARQNGLKIENADRLPHDLWAAADLPPLSLVDRLTLILIQFDLSFQVAPDGKTVSLVPLPDDVSLTRSYPGGPDPQATAERFSRLAGEARIKVADGQVFVTGLLEAHERITSAGRPHQPAMPEPAGDLADKRFTLRVQSQPAAAVLKQLAGQLDLDLRIDREAIRQAGISLESLVSASVEDATIDQLLRELLDPIRLDFRRQGRVVEVLPAR